jgi:hypothetical protein
MLNVLTATALGASTWSAAEYFIHRYLGHEYAKNRNLFAQEHVRHHATTSYFAPTVKKMAAAALATAAVAPVAVSVAGVSTGAAFTLGFVATYAGYEVIHRIAHTHAPKTRYGRWYRKHHFHHHFHNPAVNHGVTSPLFDHLIGTYEEPDVIRVPEKHAMPWLVDPSTGEVRDEHAADYTLVRKGKRARGKSAQGDSGVTGAQPSSPNSPIAAPVPGRSRSPKASMRSNLVRKSL